MNNIRLTIVLLLAFLGTTGFLNERGVHAGTQPNLATGQITSAIILQERIHLTLGDKAVTTLGAKDGVIRGDILTITGSADVNLEKHIGKCAVLSVDRQSSVCEIIAANMEIKRGSKVSIAEATTAAPQFFPAAYSLLSKSVEAYEPNEIVSVYIHDIFDEQNNVTQLSNQIRQQIENLFANKKRIRIVGAKSSDKTFHFYPNLDREQYEIRHELMETLPVDVLVSGAYTVTDANNLHLSLYKFDSRNGDARLDFNMLLTPDHADNARLVTKPYQPVGKREYVTCTVVYEEIQYAPQRDELKEIIAREAGSDAFKVNDLKKTNFNLISPVDIVIKIDDKTVNLAEKKTTPFLLTKGRHRLYAGFRRGYFFNTREPRLHVSDRLIEKEALLNIGRDGTFVIEAIFRPSFDMTNIDFKVYSVREKKTEIRKSILTTEASKSIELFQD